MEAQNRNDTVDTIRAEIQQQIRAKDQPEWYNKSQVPTIIVIRVFSSTLDLS